MSAALKTLLDTMNIDETNLVQWIHSMQAKNEHLRDQVRFLEEERMENHQEIEHLRGTVVNLKSSNEMKDRMMQGWMNYVENVKEKHQKKVTKMEEELSGCDEEIARLEAEVEASQQPTTTSHCEICLEKYSPHPDHVPKVLECGHTMCHSCAVRITGDREYIACPFDRIEFELPEEGGVEMLPRNFAIMINRFNASRDLWRTEQQQQKIQEAVKIEVDLPASMPVYTLTYFDARGFAEAARQLFHLSGTAFEDIRIPVDNLFPGKESDEWLEIKKNSPFGKVPVLSVDGFQIPQSSAICRYLAQKFGYAGKTPEEKAWADAVVDQFKDFMDAFRAVLVAQRAGKSVEEIQKIREDVFNPAKDNYFRILNGILEKREFLAGEGLTWADLVVADNLYTMERLKELESSNEEHQKLRRFQQKIYELPGLKEHIATRPDTEL
ncbi:unnamed protein product [Caenorhabditis sp. 36 PRJEB53466]|nr:unnamed protein product [Caenorhabditis sp. 36 PRJEB53466]